jgi:hypothetical protein
MIVTYIYIRLSLLEISHITIGKLQYPEYIILCCMNS